MWTCILRRSICIGAWSCQRVSASCLACRISPTWNRKTSRAWCVTGFLAYKYLIILTSPFCFVQMRSLRVLLSNFYPLLLFLEIQQHIGNATLGNINSKKKRNLANQYHTHMMKIKLNPAHEQNFCVLLVTMVWYGLVCRT